MAKPRKNNTKQPKSEGARRESWHEQGRWWLALGGVGVILVVGFVVFLLSESPALSASISVIVAALIALLELLELNHPLQRLSHRLANSRSNQAIVIVLLVIATGIWVFPGRWRLERSTCGELGCKSAAVAVRFAFDQWTGQGQAPGIDASVSVGMIRDALFQKLSCVDGFQGIEPYRETIFDELDLLINGNLRLLDNLELSAELINPRTQAIMHPSPEYQPLGDQTKFELMLLPLQNKLFQSIVETINFELKPENAALVNRIPTDNLEALRLNNQAVELILHGHLDQAEVQLKDAIARDDRYADAYNNLGRIYRQRGDLPGAIAAYKNAVRSLPCVALYHYNLGFAYEENQEYDNAIAAYKAAITRNPAYDKAFNNLGFVHLQTGQVDKAEQALQQGLKIAPEASYLYKNLGRVYLAQERTTEAIDALQEAIALFADYAEAHYYLSEAYREAGERQMACNQLVAYATLAADDALDAPARVQAATVLSTTLHCSIQGVTP